MCKEELNFELKIYFKAIIYGNLKCYISTSQSLNNMYEYKNKPSYHRPWHKRVHAFIPPPVPTRRRTQSVDPLRRHSDVFSESQFTFPSDSKHANTNCYDNFDKPSRHETTFGQHEFGIQENPRIEAKISNNEIDNILNKIRRSRSNVSNKGFGYDVLMSQKVPARPTVPPPPLPRRVSQDLSTEYQRSPFGHSENYTPCHRRSRNREVRKTYTASPQTQYHGKSFQTPKRPDCSQDISHTPSNISKNPSVERVPLASNNLAGKPNDQNEKENKRISVTEEEINSILENHRHKRTKSQSAFKMGSSRSPSTHKRIGDDNNSHPKSNENASLSNHSNIASTTEMLRDTSEEIPKTYTNKTDGNDIPTRRSRSRVKSQQIGTNKVDNEIKLETTHEMNAPKVANFTKQFSNIDAKTDDGHAKAYPNTKNNTESNTHSKPANSCVGVGNLNIQKNNNIVDYDTTLPPEKPNKEVKCNTGKNSSRNNCNVSTSSTGEGGDSLKNVAKNEDYADANDDVAMNKNDKRCEFTATSQDDGSSPSSDLEQRNDDIEELASSLDDIKWNHNPAFIEDKNDDNGSGRKSSRNSIHTNYNDLLKNMNTENGEKIDDFGKNPTDEGDKDVEDVLRDFKQRLDDMGEYLDRVKEAAVKITEIQDEATEVDSDSQTPNMATDFENDKPELNVTKNNSVDIKETFKDDANISDMDDTLINTDIKEEKRNSFIFDKVPFSNTNNWKTTKDNDEDIDTTITMTIPITRMYPSQDPLPEHLTDDVENEIQNGTSPNHLNTASYLTGTQYQSHIPANTLISR